MSSTDPNWDCPSCSESIESQFDLCWNCGTEMPAEFVRKLAADEANVEEQPGVEEKAVKRAVPEAATSMDSGLPWSVLVFAFCPPVGLVALLYSVLAEFSRIHHQRDLVLDYSRRAANWRIIAVVVWGIVLVFGFLTLITRR
jgi:hypothetical protein